MSKCLGLWHKKMLLMGVFNYSKSAIKFNRLGEPIYIATDDFQYSSGRTIEKCAFAVPNTLTEWAFGVVSPDNDNKFYNGYLGLQNIRKAPFREAKILNLVLKKRWFDLILKGVKKEEYRECKDYWKARLVDEFGEFKDFDVVRFRLGYGKEAPTIDVELLGIDSGEPNIEWCEGDEKWCYRIKLGRILNRHFI